MTIWAYSKDRDRIYEHHPRRRVPSQWGPNRLRALRSRLTPTPAELAARKRHTEGITPTDLANRLGASVNTVRNWEAANGRPGEEMERRLNELETA